MDFDFNFESFNVRTDRIYIIIETNNDFVNQTKYIGACFSYEKAKNHLTPNRIIKGPISILDTLIHPSPKKVFPDKFFEEDYKVIPPDFSMDPNFMRDPGLTPRPKLEF